MYKYTRLLSVDKQGDFSKCWVPPKSVNNTRSFQDTDGYTLLDFLRFERLSFLSVQFISLYLVYHLALMRELYM